MNGFNDFNNPNNFNRRRRVTYRPSRALAGIGSREARSSSSSASRS